MIGSNTKRVRIAAGPVFMLFSMKNLGTRIAHYRNLAGLSQAKLAKACGWASQSRIGNYEAGTREPTLDDIALIAKALHISKQDLLLTHDEQVSDKPADYVAGSPSDADYAMIPQYTARGSNGNGYHNDHVEVAGGLAFKRDWLRRTGAKPESLCVIYADGSSMEPTISDGEVLLIDRSDITPRNGKVYAFLRPDGSLSVKRLIQQVTGDWIIRSDNLDKSRYPDESIRPDDLAHINIIGRSVWRGGGM